MRIRRFLQALAVAVMVIGSVAAVPAIAASAAANPATQDKNVNLHDQLSSFEDVVPCTTIPVLVTADTNSVAHFQLQTMPDGSVRFQETFTENGTFSAMALDGSGRTYNGRFTTWDGAKGTNPVFDDQGNLVSADELVEGGTFNISGTSSDGTSFSEHTQQHMGLNPAGNIQQELHDSCPA